MINSSADIQKINQEIFDIYNGTTVATNAVKLSPNSPYGYICQLGSAVATETMWTPIILLNSPYGGQATGSSSVSITGSYSFSAGPFSLTKTTVSTSSNTLGPISNGQSDSFNELDTWTIYSTYQVACFCIEPCSQHYVSQITNQLGPSQSKTILTPGTATDRYEPNSFNMVCNVCTNQPSYPSIIFHNEFVTADNPGQSSFGSCSGAQDTYSVSQTTTSELEVSISFTISGTQYSTGGGLDMKASTQSQSSFTYTFPAYYGNWYWDNLADNGANAALAFDYLPCSFANSLYTSGYTGTGYVTTPANMVGTPDGNLGQVHASNYGDTAWVVLDLGTTHSAGTNLLIDGYSYYNTGCGGCGYYSHVEVFVSQSCCSGWTKVYDQLLPPFSPNTVIWMQVGSSITTSYRYVQIEALDDSGYSAAFWVDSIGVP